MEPNLKKILKALSLELRHLLEGWYDAGGAWHGGDLEQRLAGLGVWREREPLPADEFAHLPAADRAARQVVDAYLALRREAGVARADAMAEFVRETAYTWANRLLALRCMEARGLIDEVILQRDAYGGRSLEHHRLIRRSPELAVGEDDGLFAALDAAFVRQAERKLSMFDPHAPAMALKPSVAALRRCGALLSGLEPLRGVGPASDEVFQAHDALGWAYQYWNTEEKDRVFEKVRTQKGAKIAGADIIPATQLYTEPYMVKFLVQNSLGALWMGMHPNSRLYEKWEYYVRDADRAPVAPKPVREISFLDPATGSGHFHLEAFDLFYDMYLEEGEITDPAEICAAILEHNLYGIDIDERAIQIAEAALWMKAAERAFDFPGATMNLVATNIRLPKGKDHLQAFLAQHPEDRELRPALEAIFEGLEHADELGSLLQIEEPVEREMRYLKAHHEAETSRGVQLKMFEPTVVQGELPLGVESYDEWKAGVIGRLRAHFAAEAEAAELSQAFFGRSAGKGLALFDLLERRYEAVATNPPYIGLGKLGTVPKDYVEKHYPQGKTDLFAAFILRSLGLLKEGGTSALVTRDLWLRLSSYRPLREMLLSQLRLPLIAHLGGNAFKGIGMDEAITIAAFLIMNQRPTGHEECVCLRVVAPDSPEKKDLFLRKLIADPTAVGAYRKSQASFLSLPEYPIAYWLPEDVSSLLATLPPLGSRYTVSRGVDTCDNRRFLRLAHETPIGERRWIKYLKAGGYSRWAGFDYWSLDWQHEGVTLKQSILEKYPYLKSNSEWLVKTSTFYKHGWTYTFIARGSLGCRVLDGSHVCDSASPGVFTDEPALGLGALLNSHLYTFILRSIAADLLFREGYVGRLPLPAHVPAHLEEPVAFAVGLKQQIVSRDLIERSFDVHNPGRTDEIGSTINQMVLLASTLLHTIEGYLQDQVYNLLQVGKKAVLEINQALGIPVAWLPLIAGYDQFPTALQNTSFMAEALAEYHRNQTRLGLAPSALVNIRGRMRTLYETGSGGGRPENTSDESALVSGVENEEDTTAEARLPIPADTLLEDLSQRMGVHPVSVYWLLREGIEREGWRCLPEEQRITADRFTVIILHLLGHRWPKQIEAGDLVPDWADPDGIIPLTEGVGEPTLYDRLRDRIVAEFPDGNVTAIEAEFAEIMGKPLEQWLAADFFKHHTSQFKKRPIAWQVGSGKFTARRRPAFACLVYYHKLDANTLATIQSQYVRPLRGRYETELRGIEAIPAAARSERQAARRIELEGWIAELREFDDKLGRVSTEGFAGDALAKLIAQEPVDSWCSIDGIKPRPADREALLRQETAYIPDLNDGVRVNITPLQKAGLLAADVIAGKDIEKAIADRAEWRADERRWCREGKLPRPGWWKGA